MSQPPLRTPSAHRRSHRLLPCRTHQARPAGELQRKALIRVEGESVAGATLPLIRRSDAVEPRPMPDDGHHLAGILS
jgi:hypothetical protein